MKSHENNPNGVNKVHEISFFGTHSRENSLKRLEFQGAAWREERSRRCMKGTISKESRARKPRKVQPPLMLGHTAEINAETGHVFQGKVQQ